MRKAIGFLLLSALPALTSAQNADSVALARRVRQIVALLGDSTVRPDTIFAPSFLAQVPPAQLRTIGRQLAALGTVTATTLTARPAPGTTDPASAKFELATGKGYTIPTTLVVAAAPPNLVTGLFFGPPARAAGSIDEVVRDLHALPGHVSVYVARVDGSRLVPIVAEDTARAMPIGSAFKLYVLAELTREIEAGTRRWSDVVPLDSASKSLPSGILQGWPAGTPLTIQTLATLMISISDNTAADHLLHLLGRENVERVQALAGHSKPALNTPFLSTREMFVLKSPDRTTLLQRYIAAGVAERRAILADTMVTNRQRRGPDFSKGPIAIDAVEWFATTPDLARVMVWLRDHSASGTAAATRGVLTVNKGIAWPTPAWRYVAFKGGSEPGVLNLTFLAQRADGQWMVFVASWENPDKAVDEGQFAALVTRLRDLAANK